MSLGNYDVYVPTFKILLRTVAQLLFKKILRSSYGADSLILKMGIILPYDLNNPVFAC